MLVDPEVRSFCGGSEGGGVEPPLSDDPREEERVTG